MRVDGTLSSLRRVSEGSFSLSSKGYLNPIEHLKLSINRYLGDIDAIRLGKRLRVTDFELQSEGEYVTIIGDFFSILE